MEQTLRLDPATGDKLDDVIELLEAADLPTDDVRDGDAEFYLASDGDDPEARSIGCGGLDVRGDAALLRSVVVGEADRGEGYGRMIVDGLEESARTQGVEELYLLTTTAAEFFEKLGYERADRTSAPDGVRSTPEFGSLCPESAVCMRRRIEGSD